MSKTWLSEYTDRSEPTASSPEEVSERLGVPLVGGDQGRTSIQENLPNKPTGVCAKCGLTLYTVMHYVCPNGAECPAGLGGRVTL